MMIASTTRDRHGDGRNIIDSQASESAISTVTPRSLTSSEGTANGR